ncbi:uncharacterized protein LJ264_007443 isoform 2-T3 [Porphyrio hochstetteri]
MSQTELWQERPLRRPAGGQAGYGAWWPRVWPVTSRAGRLFRRGRSLGSFRRPPGASAAAISPGTGGRRAGGRSAPPAPRVAGGWRGPRRDQASTRRKTRVVSPPPAAAVSARPAPRPRQRREGSACPAVRSCLFKHGERPPDPCRARAGSGAGRPLPAGRGLDSAAAAGNGGGTTRICRRDANIAWKPPRPLPGRGLRRGAAARKPFPPRGRPAGPFVPGPGLPEEECWPCGRVMIILLLL